MEAIRVVGGKQLSGEVAVSGSKNAALPILFATLLAEGEHTLYNVPQLRDIDSSFELLDSLGCRSVRDGEMVKISVPAKISHMAHYDLVRKMRASILCLGPLLARFGKAKVSLPGGCAIGLRPINLHIEGLKKLGAEISVRDGYVIAEASRLVGDRIFFESVTVGGTENLLMAACLAKGETIIENAAKEPEVVDLANYLVEMGAKIEGIGTGILSIKGVEKLCPKEPHRIIPDRIEAGTLLIAGAITKGSVKITNCVPEHFSALSEKLRSVGFKLDETCDSITIEGLERWTAVDIATSPYPGFPTDLQAQFMALMSLAEGTSIVSEGIFENRFMHVQELMRMSADITPKSRVAVVRGKPDSLTGAPVMATDLRASASLVLAGLAAKGETLVKRIYHLDRGYEALEEKLSSLGATIVRCKE